MKKEKKKRSKISNMLFIIFLVIIIPVLIVLTTILIKSITKPEEIPSFMGYKPMIVLSGSMETKLHKGDVAIVKIVEFDSLKIDDIIAFRNIDDTVTTHRIVDITYENNEKLYVTKGDANNTNDSEKVTNSSIEGKYIFKIVGLGAFLMWIQTSSGLLISLLVVVLIAGTYFFIKNQKELKSLKEK